MRVAVVIPAYKVKSPIFAVIAKVPKEADAIFVVDDCCPQGTGRYVQSECNDPRVTVIFQPRNSGVGAATMAGIIAAAKAGYDVAVKIDGDGQMDPKLLGKFTKPIRQGKADYAKGNRFYSPSSLASMPRLRVFGNAAISFLAKATTGYWNVMDSTNGYFAIHTALVPILEVEKIAPRYFFENDLLFRLSLVRAVVVDVPMNSIYGEEVSNLSIAHTMATFPQKFVARFFKRIMYQYFLRDFNLGSVFLVMGSLFSVAGVTFGIRHWLISLNSGHLASTGTVMLAALPTMIGFQMLTFTVLYDVLMVPKAPIHFRLKEDSDEPQSVPV